MQVEFSLEVKAFSIWRKPVVYLKMLSNAERCRIFPSGIGVHSFGDSPSTSLQLLLTESAMSSVFCHSHLSQTYPLPFGDLEVEKMLGQVSP